MARLINAYCRKNHLIYIETGTRQGQAVLWFLDFDGQRVCIPASAVQSQETDRDA